MRIVTRTWNRISRLAIVGVVTSMAIGSAVALAANPAAAAAANAPTHRAIVSIATDGPVTVPGVRVVAELPAVQAEVVDGTDAGLQRLASDPRVLGIARDQAVELTSVSFGAHSRSNHGNHGSKDKSGKTDDDSVGGQHGHTPAASTSVLAPASVGGDAGSATAGHGVTVAVIDTGVSDTPALNRASGRLVDAVDTSGLIKGKPVKTHGTFNDGYGHGTFMASLIAGGPVPGSDGVGVGVAPGAKVDVVKVADNNGNTSLASVLAGLNWVATHASSVDIANLSLSVDKPLGIYGVDPLNFAVELTRKAGVLVVVSAGNTANKVGDPGFDPSALTVGSADTTGAKAKVASFSGSAVVAGVSKPDVVAAGVNILGVMPTNADLYRQYPQARQANGLFRGSGTSQSAAIVSGVAAIYKQDHPTAGVAELKSAMRSAATGIGGGIKDGEGLVAVPGHRYGDSNTGEQGFQPWRWYITGLAWGPVFGSDLWDSRRWSDGNWDSRRWSNADWNSRRWSSDDWNSRRWSNIDWDSRRWSVAAWDSRRWSDAAWDSRRWSDASWDSRRWSDDAWDSRRWSDASWDSRRWSDASWDSRRWSDASWDSRRWSADNWDSRRWSTETWDSRRWSAASWGDQPA